VVLDGHRLTAIVDTGAQRTTLSVGAARALGLGPPDVVGTREFTTKGAAGETLSSRMHRFARFELGPVAIRNPEIVVTDLRLRDAHMVLGMDFLGSHRLLLSYAAFRIFVSEE